MIKIWVGAAGLISRNARSLSFSKTLSAGISPEIILQNKQSSMVLPFLTTKITNVR
jgi:hypothetical protein